LHRTLLDEHFRGEGRRTWFDTVEEMQAVLDRYLQGYNDKRPHQGRGMNGRTPARAFKEGLPKNPVRKETTPPAIASETRAARAPRQAGPSGDYPLCTLRVPDSARRLLAAAASLPNSEILRLAISKGPPPNWQPPLPNVRPTTSHKVEIPCLSTRPLAF